MMKKLFLLPLALSIVFCSFSAPTQDVASIVSATLTAVAAQAQPTTTPSASTATPTALPTTVAAASQTPTAGARDFFPPNGKISGQLSYPASSLPPMRVTAFRVDDGSASFTDTAAGQSTYELELPGGDYHIVAYSLGGGGFPSGLAGGYTKAVPCGLSADCTDHTLIVVTLVVSTTLTNINPGDWYADPSAFPPMPKP
jgi:hypothetical protein